MLGMTISQANLTFRVLGSRSRSGSLWLVFSSPEQHSWRAIVLRLASASTNDKVFIKVFKTSLFPNLITDLLHVWFDDTYWSKILRSPIPTTLGHVRVKVTDLEFSC